MGGASWEAIPAARPVEQEEAAAAMRGRQRKRGQLSLAMPAAPFDADYFSSPRPALPGQ